MRKFSNLLIGAFCMATLFSCQKDKSLATPAVEEDIIAEEVQLQIKAHGFSSTNAHKVKEGYIVEGDIVLTPEFLKSNPSGKLLKTAEAEQYRTTYLVTSLPRVIKVKMSGLGTAFITAMDEAIKRYNDLELRITFQKISSGVPDISIIGYNQGPTNGYITLGTSGFPNSSGKPYNTIMLNTHRFALGTNPNPLYAATIIQHEIGHCIGFRHSDYMNRSYSCGGAVVNEGAGNSGAILITGTPASPEPDSWMLACNPINVSRSFNANDILALNTLYKF